MEKPPYTPQVPEIRSIPQARRAGAAPVPPATRPQDSRSAQPYIPIADEPAAARGQRKWWLPALLLAAGVAAGGLYFGLSSRIGDSAAGGSSTPVLQIGAADIDVDATALARSLLLAGEFDSVPAAGERAPVTVPAKEQPATLATAASPAPESAAPRLEAGRELVRNVLAHATPAMRAQIASGGQAIYRLQILDNVVEDGDAVVLYVNGASFGRVDLTNQGLSVLLALPRQALSQIRVLAVADGGGGVTFGAASSAGDVRTKVMGVGNSDEWTVVPR